MHSLLTLLSVLPSRGLCALPSGGAKRRVRGSGGCAGWEGLLPRRHRAGTPAQPGHAGGWQGGLGRSGQAAVRQWLGAPRAAGQPGPLAGPSSGSFIRGAATHRPAALLVGFRPRELWVHSAKLVWPGSSSSNAKDGSGWICPNYPVQKEKATGRLH